MILDDYYLKMNRYNFSEQLLKNIDDSIQVEFELIKDMSTNTHLRLKSRINMKQCWFICIKKPIWKC